MVSRLSNSDVNAPNLREDFISDDDLLRGFILALAA